tara:strand:+ start:322 stop:624 length:303 start_codon:yes stop_codon:yes gene_type:complete
LTVANEDVFSEDEDDEFDDGYWVWCFPSVVILMILLPLLLIFVRDLTQEEEKDATEAIVETGNRLRRETSEGMPEHPKLEMKPKPKIAKKQVTIKPKNRV